MNRFLINSLIILLSLDVMLNDLNFYQFKPLVYLIGLYPLFFVPQLLHNTKRERGFLISILFLILIISIIILINYDNQDLEGKTAITYHYPIIIKYLLYFFIGFNYSLMSKKILNYSLIIIIVGFLSLFDFNTYTIDFFKLLDPDSRGVLVSSSDLLGLFLLLYGSFNKKWNIYKVLIYVISIFFIFISGSRTTFALLVLSIIIHYYSNIRYIILISIFIYLFISPIIEFLQKFEWLNEFRFMSLLDYKNDKSYIERSVLLEAGIDDVIQNPLFGDFGGQLRHVSINKFGNRWGAYIHNILSFYRQFGLIVFIYVSVLIYKSVKILSSHKKDYLPFLFFIVVSIIISRSYVFPFIFFIFGLTVNVLKNEKSNILS